MDTRQLFYLKPGLHHLNHGSFGACPQPIFENYQYWQMELEKSPVQFITKLGPAALQQSKEALANFIHCNPHDLVYTTNPSYELNIVAKDFPLEEGDEILTTDQEYGALIRTWNYYCRKKGAKFVQQSISLPIVSKEQIIEEFFQGVTPKTKAIFISHITSSTALIFPVKEICKRAKQLGLITIVDGAHVPGHIDLNLSELEADIYSGACHKWLLTPKGNSFLYVKKAFQDYFDPLIISWGYEADNPGISTFLDSHEYQGTRDFSAFLTTPTALEFRREYDWEAASTNCKARIRAVYQELCDIVGSQPICPVTEEFLGQMCAVPVKIEDAVVLKEIMFNEYNIEMPVTTYGKGFFLRLSIQPYVSEEDIEALKSCLRELKEKGVLQ